MSRWLTPEEMFQKRKRKKMLLYMSIPLIGIIVGVLITLLLSYL